MNREIKFRIWSKESPKNKMIGIVPLLSDFWKNNKHNSEEIEVMQYTGIKMYEGEVYEGDIIRDDEGDQFVVVWDETDARFMCELVGEEGYGMYDSFSLSEICTTHSVLEGNIYENPNLLNHA